MAPTLNVWACNDPLAIVEAFSDGMEVEISVQGWSSPEASVCGEIVLPEADRYDNAANQISTNVRFSFDRENEHLEGNSFRSDPDFRNVVTDRPRGTAGTGLLLPGQEKPQ